MKSISSIAILAASLLVKDVLAGPILVRDTVEVDVEVQDEVTVYENPDGSFSTGIAVAVATITQNGQAQAAPSSIQPAVASVAPAAPVSSSIAPVAPAAPVSAIVQSSAAESSATKAPATSVQVKPSTASPPAPPATPTTLATKASSTAAPASSTAASGTTGGNGSKRGLAYTAVADTAPFPTASYSWMYNWAVENGASTTNSMPKGVEYVPMLWGLASASGTAPKDSNFVAGTNTAISNGATHLLGFNEPDLPSANGADLTVAQAVQGWNANMKQFAGKVKLGSPAVTNGVTGADGHVWGLDWLGNFTQTVDVDFICIHWYGGDTLANSVADLKSHVQQANQRFPGKNIWITEFQYTGSGAQDQFLEQVVPWLDSQSYVERYAYYLAGQGSDFMVSGTSLNTIGQAYVSTN